MKRLNIFIAVVLAVLASAAYAESPAMPDCMYLSASASALSTGNTEIRIKPSAIIGGFVRADTLFIKGDGLVKFPVELVNRDPVSYNGGFHMCVYSPDGANWKHATANGGNYKSLPASMTGIWVDTTGEAHGGIGKDQFGAIYKFNLFGADGLGEDTVIFVGAANDVSQTAIRPSDSEIMAYIVVNLRLADTGKHICLDSTTFYPPSCGWGWSTFNYIPSYSTSPASNGPWCFQIKYSCCKGLTGNYDCDPDDNCDISDVTAFVDRYTTLAMPCCPGEANTDGSPDGNSDISDLTALIDYLYISFTPPAPCR